MNVQLTITKKDGTTVCENEKYSFSELYKSPAFSNDERRCYLDLLSGGIGAISWPRGDSTFRIVRI